MASLLPVQDLTTKFTSLRKDMLHRRGIRGIKLSGGTTLSHDPKEDTIELVEKHVSGLLADRRLLEAPLPPAWYDGVVEIKSNLITLSKCIAELEESQRRQLMRVMKDRNFKTSESELKRKESKIMSQLKTAQLSLKQLKGSPQGSSPIAISIRFNAIENVARYLLTITSEFHRVQQSYAEQMDKRYRSSRPAMISDELLPNHDSLLPTSVGEEMMQMQDLHQRNQTTEINAMVKRVDEVHQLFMNMSDLVVEQGDMVDRIDYNIDIIALKVEDAHVQLLIAEDRHSNGLAKKVILGLSLYNVACMVVLGIKLSLKFS